MDSNDIRNAIMLFESSDTSQQFARAALVIKKLWSLYKANDIAFWYLGPATEHYASYKQNRSKRDNGNAADIQINTAYMESVPASQRLGRLSLSLVHEAVHAVLQKPRLNEELFARILAIYYFRELSGPGVLNEATDPPAPGQRTETVWFPPSSVPYFDEQNAAFKRNQLIDLVLSVDSYSADDYLTKDWIVANLTNFGGLGNRWPETRGLYIAKLAAKYDPHYTPVILDIMESVSSRADWDLLMANAGGLRTIQIGLEELTLTPLYARRITALERRWRVQLTDEPPA